MLPIISKRDNLIAFYKRLSGSYLDFYKFVEDYAHALSNQIEFQWGHLDKQDIYLFCGSGLNGRYALALAKELRRIGSRNIFIYLYSLEGRYSKDVELLLRELVQYDDLTITEVNLSNEFRLPDSIKPNDLLIDGLVGYEQDDVLPKVFLRLIDTINHIDCTKLSIEVPSGITFREDKLEPKLKTCIRANYTYGLALPSLKMFLKAYQEFFGFYKVLKADTLHSEFLLSDFQLIEDEELYPLLQKSQEHYTASLGSIFGGDSALYGHLLITAKSALYTGIGDLRVYTHREAGLAMQMQQDDLTVYSFEEFESQHKVNDEHQIYSILSPEGGLMDVDSWSSLLAKFDTSLLLGANASKYLIQNTELINLIPKGSILILSDKDFLDQEVLSDSALLEKAQTLAKQYELNILLLSNRSYLCLEDGKVYLQGYVEASSITKSNMEVLTGIILSLRINNPKLSLREVLALASYIYREAIILCQRKRSLYTLLADDIISNIPEVYASLHQ